MTDGNVGRLEPVQVEALYAWHARDLQAFLVGVLRDADLAKEALQATFARTAESGHTAQEESVRGWLFRVAYNEVLGLRRMQAQHDKLIRKAAWEYTKEFKPAEDEVQQTETVERVRRALEGLPSEQAEIVRLRIYEQLKFADIADRLGLPLGTVLSRMRLALQKLETHFEGWNV